MSNTYEKYRIVRVGHRSPEARFWQSQLDEMVLPFRPAYADQRPRRVFPLPDDAITLVAEDYSQLDPDGKPKAVGSVSIKRLLPGGEQSAGLSEGTQYGEIKRMVVMNTHQGTGIAARLLETAQDAGKTEFNLQCILVATWHTLKRAQRFYEKCGFKKREEFGAYYSEVSVCYEKWV